jgi:hypothetical protein
MMRVHILALALSTLVVTAGCGGEGSREALLNEEMLARELDLALDAHANRAAPQFQDGPAVDAAPVAAPVAAAPAPAPRPQAAARSVPVRSAPAPIGSAPAPAPAPQPRVVTQTNVKRDAAIGAGVGAAAGAIIHKPNRVKGAVVGAVVGGAAGAVVGATIDKKTTVVYD